MNAHRIVAALMALVMVSGSGFAGSANAQPVAAVPPAPAGAPYSTDSIDAIPPRVSYLNGEVSFWRPGATDWAPAQVNTPLAPGDALYAGQGGGVEIQIGQAAFVRANSDTQIGLDNQDANFVQFRVTAGQAGIDLRQLAAGSTVEIDTPNGAFTIDRGGYYHVDVQQDATAFVAYRGGAATVTTASGEAAPIGANQQVVLTGADSPQVAIGAAPPLTAWDNWNNQRTASLVQPASARYVSPAMYGTPELDRYGTWRTAESYGSVWVPSGVPAGWQPYSTGRWIWDPRYGWTWLDDAPWGWAPYHHGRWVFTNNYWAWAPGPVVVRPAYAPALVVFLGGVSVGIGSRPLCWAPLSWGEPVIPWWGRQGFAGVPWWGGWGGPRVVNNTVINRNTTVNVTNINVYRNVQVNRAVVGVPADRFGHGRVQVERINQAEVQQLRPVRGAPDVRPVAASVMPGTGAGVRPPTAVERRQVVATRAPRDLTPTLREHGLAEHREAVTAPRIVPAPRPGAPPASAPSRGVGNAPEPGGVTAGQAPRGPGRNGGEPQRGTPPPPPGAAKAPREAPQPEPQRGMQPPPPPGAAKATPPREAPQPEQRRGMQQPPPPPGAAKAPREAPQPEQQRGMQPPPPPGAAKATLPREAPQPEQRRGMQQPPPPPGAAKAPREAPQPEQQRGTQPPPPPGAAKAPREAPQPEQQRGTQPPPPPGAAKAPREAPQPEQQRGMQPPPPGAAKAPREAPQPEQQRGGMQPPPPPGAAKAPREAPQPEQQRGMQPPPPGAAKAPREAPQPEQRRAVQPAPPPPPGAAKAAPPREAPQPEQRRAVQPAPPPAPPGAAKSPREVPPQAEQHRPPPPGAANGTPGPTPPAGQTVRNVPPPAARPAPAPRPDHPAPAEKPDRPPKGEAQDKNKDR